MGDDEIVAHLLSLLPRTAARRVLLNKLSAACKQELGGDLEQGAWPEFVAMRERVADLERINREQAQACLELSQLNARLKAVIDRGKKAAK